MKILHIITDSNIGGAGRHLLTLLKFYDRAVYTIEVVLPRGSKLIPVLRELDTAYTEAPIAEKSFSLRGLAALVRIIRASGARIVHTHASLAGRIAARICGCKVIHSRHSVFEPPAAHTRFPRKQILGRLNNTLSDRIIAVSPAAQEILTATGTNPAKIVVVYNGVEEVAESPTKEIARQKYGLSPETFVVLQLARLTPVKGHDYTLDASKIWAGSDITVLIAGDGPYAEHLTGRIKNEGLTNVKLLGFTDPSELLGITDVQISASYGTEATSLSLLEGMSLGLPAVASDFGGNPYVITDGKNGLLVPSRDSGALARAVLTIKNDERLRENLSRGARAEYLARFTAAKMAHELEKVYEGL